MVLTPKISSSSVSRDNELTAFINAVVSAENWKAELDQENEATSLKKPRQNNELKQGKDVGNILLRSVYYSRKDDANEKGSIGTTSTTSSNCTTTSIETSPSWTTSAQATVNNNSQNNYSFGGKVSQVDCPMRSLLETVPNFPTWGQGKRNDKGSSYSSKQTLRLFIHSKRRSSIESMNKVEYAKNTLTSETMHNAGCHGSADVLENENGKELAKARSSVLKWVDSAPVKNNAKLQAARGEGSSESSTHRPGMLHNYSTGSDISGQICKYNAITSSNNEKALRIECQPSLNASRVFTDKEEIITKKGGFVFAADSAPRIEGPGRMDQLREDLNNRKEVNRHHHHSLFNVPYPQLASDVLYNQHHRSIERVRNGFWSGHDGRTPVKRIDHENSFRRSPQGGLTNELSRSTSSQNGRQQHAMSAHAPMDTLRCESAPDGKQMSPVCYFSEEGDGRLLSSRVHMASKDLTDQTDPRVLSQPKYLTQKEIIVVERAPAELPAKPTMEADQAFLKIVRPAIEQPEALYNRARETVIIQDANGRQGCEGDVFHQKEDASSWQTEPEDPRSVKRCPPMAHNTPVSNGQFLLHEKRRHGRPTDHGTNVTNNSINLSHDNEDSVSNFPKRYKVDAEAPPLKDRPSYLRTIHSTSNDIKEATTEMRNRSSYVNPILVQDTPVFENSSFDDPLRNMRKVLPKILNGFIQENGGHDPSNQATRPQWMTTAHVGVMVNHSDWKNVEGSFQQQQAINENCRSCREQCLHSNYLQSEFSSLDNYRDRPDDLRVVQNGMYSKEALASEPIGDGRYRKSRDHQMPIPSEMSLDENSSDTMLKTSATVSAMDANYSWNTSSESSLTIRNIRIHESETVPYNEKFLIPDEESFESVGSETVVVYIDSKSDEDTTPDIADCPETEAVKDNSGPESNADSPETVDDYPHLKKLIQFREQSLRKWESKADSPSRPRAYRCDYHGCTRAYCKSSHLVCHQRLHTGERPYQCMWKECDMTFRRSDELKRHYRSHTGEKPYECPCCFRTFSRSDHRMSHLKKMHNVMTLPAEADIC